MLVETKNEQVRLKIGRRKGREEGYEEERIVSVSRGIHAPLLARSTDEIGQNLPLSSLGIVTNKFSV